MLRIIKPTILLRSPFRKIPSFQFSIEQAQAKLKNAISQQLKKEVEINNEYQAAKEELSHRKWGISADGNSIQLERSRGMENIKLLINPKSIITQYYKIPREKVPEQIVDATLFITRKGVEKSLCGELLLTERKYFLGAIYFSDENKVRQKKMSDKLITKNYYEGPEMCTLDAEFHEGIKKYLEEIGINENVLKLVFQFAMHHFASLKQSWVKNFQHFV